MSIPPPTGYASVKKTDSLKDEGPLRLQKARALEPIDHPRTALYQQPPHYPPQPVLNQQMLPNQPPQMMPPAMAMVG